MRSLLSFVIILALCSCCDHESIGKNIRALGSGVVSERNKAALALASCGEDAKDAVPMLARLIYDPNVGVQSSAAYALRKIDTEEAQAVLERAIAKRKKH